MTSVSYGPGDLAEGHVDGELGALRTVLPSYDIGEVLGRGAWGTVVGGYHRALNRAIAVKWLRPELVDDAEARARFNAEAQVLASLAVTPQAGSRTWSRQPTIALSSTRSQSATP